MRKEILDIEADPQRINELLDEAIRSGKTSGTIQKDDRQTPQNKGRAFSSTKSNKRI